MTVPNVVTVTSTTGVRFNARLLRASDRYGLNDALTVGKGTSFRIEGSGPFVEFYDTRYEHTPLGQFVSRYGVRTILESTGGLDLMSYEPSWKIDANAMAIVRIWLNHMTEGGDGMRSVKDKVWDILAEMVDTISDPTQAKDIAMSDARDDILRLIRLEGSAS